MLLHYTGESVLHRVRHCAMISVRRLFTRSTDTAAAAAATEDHYDDSVHATGFIVSRPIYALCRCQSAVRTPRKRKQI